MNILCSPHTEDIENHLMSQNATGKRILHLTPTMILYRRRIKFYAKKLRSVINAEGNSTANDGIENTIRKYIDLYEANHFIQSLKPKEFTSIVSKSEATVILERIIKENPTTNNSAWISVIDDIYSLYSELNLSGLNQTELKNIDTSRKWSQLMMLYESYREQLKLLGLEDKSSSNFKSLSNLDVTPYDELVLDGAFLPITPPIQLIIDKFEACNKQITVLLPFDLEVPEHPALKAIKDVYENFIPVSSWNSIQEKKTQTYFIDRLPKNIFSTAEPTHLDASFEILRFDTLEEELTFIMQKIYVLIKHKEVCPKQIVIVTPGAMELRPLIREISEQYNLKVHLPKRPLMHLSQGRALRYLFDIYTDIRKEEETYFSNKIMKILINNSLLIHSPSLLNAFEKIECFFEDCNSINSYINQLHTLATSKTLIEDNHQHHPLNGVSVYEINELVSTLRTVHEISSSLIQVENGTVSEHAERLINTLKTHKQIKEIDPIIWERIFEITELVKVQRNLKISGMEFGTRITALFAEQEEFEPGDQPEDNGDDIYLEKEILVTGPNNVEFQKYEYVFLCRFTQDVYPESKKYNWLLSKETEQQILQKSTKFNVPDTRSLETFYLDRSIYHVYLSLRAANTQLTISYSKLDNGQSLAPSHYLHDIAKVFGIKEGNRLENKKEESLEKLLENEKIIKTPSSLKPINNYILESIDNKMQISDKIFTAEDVAIFQYCQRRFYYQSKHNNEKLYTQLFHLQTYASSCLYEKAVELLIEKENFPITESLDLKRQQGRLQEKMQFYRETAEELIRAIFPFGNRQWHNVVAQTDFFLRSLLTSIFENAFVKEYRKQGNSLININMSLSNRTEEIIVDDYVFTSTKELEIQYNNGEIHRYSISNLKDFLSFSSKDYDEKEVMEEMKQWYFSFKREFKNQTPLVKAALKQISTTIQNGFFEKNIGGHCMYCTFNKICREREVEL